MGKVKESNFTQDSSYFYCYQKAGGCLVLVHAVKDKQDEHTGTISIVYQFIQTVTGTYLMHT
jgi:hypothetical protein